MGGEEGQAVRIASDPGARHDQRFLVLLVLDLADPGGAVGVGELEGLQVVGVEAAAADGEGEVSVARGLALLNDGHSGGDDGQGRRGEG